MIVSFISKLRMPEERGIASATMAKCRSYVEIGCETELLIPQREQVYNLKNVDIWDHYQIPKSTFQIHKLFCIELPLGTFFEFIFKSLRYLIMSWSFSLSVLFYLWKNNRSVVHFYQDCWELLFLLKLVSFFYHPIVICEFHFRPTNLYSEIMEKISANRSDVTIVITKSLKRFYLKLGIDSKKMLSLTEGVRLEDFNNKLPKEALRHKLNLPLDAIIIGYGGRFVTARMEKGIPELIKAITLLQSKYPKIFLVCVGGPKFYVDKYKVLTKHMKDRVIILDHVPPLTLYEYMRVFDICVLPFPRTKHFAYDMSPLKMFESMASKNPIIATSLPSIMEVLKHRKNAFLVKPGNVRALARGIETLIKDKSLAAILAKNAFAEVSQKFTWQERAKTITDRIQQY